MLKRFILWDFARQTWQYDVMVGIILAFIFLTPRDWFRDQPRIATASSIVMLPNEGGSTPFLVLPGVLAGVADNQRERRLTEAIESSTGNRRLRVVRVEPILDSEGELLFYKAFARP